MKRFDVDISDIEEAIQKTNEAVMKRVDARHELLELRRHLETFKVAAIQLTTLREDFERGNITAEDYQVQSKKLRTDMERARNDANLLSLIDKIVISRRESLLQRAKNAITNNKEFIITVLEIVKALI